MAELQEQEHNCLIQQVTHPTEWCSPIVVVPKKDPSKIRLADGLNKYRGLNKYVQRELPGVSTAGNRLECSTR